MGISTNFKTFQIIKWRYLRNPSARVLAYSTSQSTHLNRSIKNICGLGGGDKTFSRCWLITLIFFCKVKILLSFIFATHRYLIHFAAQNKKLLIYHPVQKPCIYLSYVFGPNQYHSTDWQTLCKEIKLLNSMMIEWQFFSSNSDNYIYCTSSNIYLSQQISLS